MYIFLPEKKKILKILKKQIFYINISEYVTVVLSPE